MELFVCSWPLYHELNMFFVNNSQIWDWSNYICIYFTSSLFSLNCIVCFFSLSSSGIACCIRYFFFCFCFFQLFLQFSPAWIIAPTTLYVKSLYVTHAPQVVYVSKFSAERRWIRWRLSCLFLFQHALKSTLKQFFF